VVRHFIKWAYGSLIGHVVFFELFFTLPLLAMFSYSNWDTITLEWILRMVLISPVLGAMVGAYAWYAITAPSMRRRGLKPRR
jgi:hypothetical protein